jgi:type IV pilus assembly protein PilP
MIKRNKMTNYYPVILLLIAGSLLSGGCNKEEQSSPAPPAQKAIGKNTPPPVQKQQSSVSVPAINSASLDFVNRKDPFKPFVTETPHPEKGVGTSRSADLLPIQSYEVSKFKVVGIIVGLKENRALVIDPSGKGYVVKQGMLIGDSDGRIERITATTIDILEKYRDESGRIKSRTVKLTLPQKK